MARLKLQLGLALVICLVLTTLTMKYRKKANRHSSDEWISTKATEQLLNGPMIGINIEANATMSEQHIFKNPCWFSGKPSEKTIKCLPSFYVPGFNKGGTTNICRWMSYHQHIAPPYMKELNFWNNHTEVDEEYFTLLRSASLDILRSASVSESGQYIHEKITYDCDPNYAWQLPQTPQSIYDSNPNTKLIFVMRHPTDRAYSAYHHQAMLFHKDFSPQQFSEDAISSTRKIRECEEEHPTEYCLLNAKGIRLYVKMSIYHVFIKIWARVFPWNQIMFVKAEDFYDDPVSVMTRIFQFLNISEANDDVKSKIAQSQMNYIIPGIEHYRNLHGVRLKGRDNVERARAQWDTYRDTMSNETRTVLDRFYQPYNKILAELLADDRFLFERN